MSCIRNYFNCLIKLNWLVYAIYTAVNGTISLNNWNKSINKNYKRKQNCGWLATFRIFSLCSRRLTRNIFQIGKKWKQHFPINDGHREKSQFNKHFGVTFYFLISLNLSSIKVFRLNAKNQIKPKTIDVCTLKLFCGDIDCCWIRMIWLCFNWSIMFMCIDVT